MVISGKSKTKTKTEIAMRSQRHIARDITYSHSAKTRSGHTMIHLLENFTRRLQLIKRAQAL